MRLIEIKIRTNSDSTLAIFTDGKLAHKAVPDPALARFLDQYWLDRSEEPAIRRQLKESGEASFRVRVQRT